MIYVNSLMDCCTEAKSKVPDWGIKPTLPYSRVEVDSGIGLPNAPMVNVLESTLEWT